LGYFLENEGFDVTIIHNGKKPPLVDLVFSNMLPSTSDINVTKETMRIYRNLEEEYKEKVSEELRSPAHIPKPRFAKDGRACYRRY